MLQSTTIRLKTKKETLRLNLEFDLTTGLPLLREQDNILQLILTYLSLPYSIAEYGCGRKTSIILKKLLDLGIPFYALRRGMIMEKDMSDKALAENDFKKRKHALVLENPLYHKTELKDPVLLEMLEDCSVYVHIENAQIHAEDYVLSHQPQIQFVQARSHIFTLITFWDDEKREVVERVIDPTISPESLFDMTELREKLHAPEGLIFTAHIMANFRLDEDFLTEDQKRQAGELTDKELAQLSHAEHATLVRAMNGASSGSIGDPAEWTYANNIVHERPVEFDQRHNTGRGDVFTQPFEDLVNARERNSNEVLHHREYLDQLGRDQAVEVVIKEDADWSEHELNPLADVANTISCFQTLQQVADWLGKNKDMFAILGEETILDDFHGFGVRLRKRIEDLADVSKDDDYKIDARVFSECYNDAVVETIRQMNDAGLSVFIDKAGNLHGLLIKPSVAQEIRDGKITISSLTEKAICHCSHIDTVKDAGKYDGRLGVLSGIEIAHTLHDLDKYFGVNSVYPDFPHVMMVTAFTGEEMTYTGEDVAMPGSAAVTGLADPAKIYHMENYSGEKFGDKFNGMLGRLKGEQHSGKIELINAFQQADDDALFDACFEPTDFFTPYSYERHVEQGPVLDRHDVPLVLVDTIMGIHQEDFYIKGELAETAALELNRLLRHVSLMREYSDVRITSGIIDHFDSNGQAMEAGFAQRWTLIGEKNHAGATLPEDRRDPGVALARLTRYFLHAVDKLNEDRQDDYFSPIIGEVALDPGTNRNVIPEKASITFGIRNRFVPEEQKHLINYSLQHFVVSVLSPSVRDGGEGVNICRVQSTDFLHMYNNVRLSIDLRAPDNEKMECFRAEIDDLLKQIKERFNVTVESRVEQKVEPYFLRESGQVLQIERSFGGSHNPNEAELAADLVRGSLLQFASTLNFIGREQIENLKLFEMVEDHIPREWKKKLPSFVSGALHDTCNIAAVSLKKEQAR